MSLDVQKDRVPLNKITHAIRASQAVLQYGVGAMIDFPDQTLMTAAPEYWDKQVEVIHDGRLERALRVNHFGIPGNKDDSKYKDGIAYVRFPEWYFCPKCRKFQPLSGWLNDYKKKGNKDNVHDDPYMVSHMKCPMCYQDLVVARVITVCEHGHISDFPWVAWVHCQNKGGHKKICANPVLTFKTGASSAEGLEGLEVACQTCNARATLKGAFDPGRFEALDKATQGEYRFHCAGRHPWKHKVEACGLYPRALQRGSSSVYFPVTVSSLVIPPYSSILTTRIEESTGYANCKIAISNALKISGLSPEAKQQIIDGSIIGFAKEIAIEISADEEKVKAVLERKWKSPEQEEFSAMGINYRAEEYEALSGATTVPIDDAGEFLREDTKIEEYGLPFVRQIALIHKIREVDALIGFSRINPVDKSEAAGLENMVSIKEPLTDWYPAHQVRGEGIFVEFDSNAINSWLSGNKTVQDRVDIINENYSRSSMGQQHPRTITAKFVLLHTIAHLLIKQLSFECGYSIASLRERIYSAEKTDGKEMQGILVYTASGDSEGTMGGLVRQGRADVFPNIFRRAIESAEMCSNDPVCSMSTGQGRDSLNLAACYSCTLIPETSCEEFNVFLDRGMLVGTNDRRDFGFFSEMLFGIGQTKPEEKPTSHANVEEVKSKKKIVTLIPGAGTNLQASSYDDIWQNLLLWADGPAEEKLLNNLLNMADQFSGKEKPLRDCEFTLLGIETGGSFVCDLLWQKSKVLLFTEAQKDDYEAAKDSDWTCFFANDPLTDINSLLNAIKEN